MKENPNSGARRVRDLMVSLDEYAVVNEEDTLLAAVITLDKAHMSMQNGGHRHRAVLVRNRNGRIVGKVGHHAFLKAIRTVGQRMKTDPRLIRAGVDEEMMRQSSSVYRMLCDDLTCLCENARSIRVGDAMQSVIEHIDEKANLVDALDAFDRWQCQSLLVIRGRDTIGILRLVDLYDEIAATMKQCAQGEER